MAPRSKPAVEAPAEAATDWDSADAVRVRCVSHLRPHTHDRGLEHGEEVDLPADLAAAMVERGQVERV